MSKSIQSVRYAEVDRETAETSIHAVLDLDGGERQDIGTGLGFFDHMLHQMAFHGRLNIGLSVEGDLQVDDHHTVEDVGIVIGRCLKEACQGEPIERYASNHTVMDESLVLVAMDIRGRGILTFDVPFKREKLGDLSTECVKEFFRAMCSNAGLTLHIRKVAGENDHHLCEAIFKGVGRALHEATRPSDRRVSSTKGSLD
jgi:imidazoleglycerol-phosphate dehydratase